MLGSIPAIVRKPAAYLLTIPTPLISNAPHRTNVSALRITQQLPQAHDHVVHRALIQKLVLAPQRVQNFITTHDAWAAGYQQLQQFKIASRGILAPSIRLYDHAIA